MKLLGSNKSNVTKDKNGENVPNLEIAEVVLAHCNIFYKFKKFNKFNKLSTRFKSLVYIYS